MKKILVISLLTGFLTYSYADWFPSFKKTTYEQAESAIVDGDESQAVKLYEQACNEGESKGCNDAGYHYRFGRGVSKNQQTSLQLYKKACDMGYGIACKNANEIDEEVSKENTLNRIQGYEKKYLAEHNRIVSSKPKMLTTYIQPANKKESCKLYMAYAEGDKYFEKDESYKIYWDGSCKDGYASGLGREIEKADMVDKWAIAVYEKGIPTYYVSKDILHQVVTEEVNTMGKKGYQHSIKTVITEKFDDIGVMTYTGSFDETNQMRLLTVSSPFWNGYYALEKGYLSFRYLYNNFRNDDNPESKMDFEFILQDHNGNNNGWTLAKDKKGNFFTGEFVGGKFQSFDLPESYSQKADEIIKEVFESQQKAIAAQQQAQLVKRSYKNKICKDNVKVSFMDNNEYKEICSDKKDLELFEKINKKVEKLTLEKIARLEQQRYQQSQIEEKRKHDQMLALEKERLALIQKQYEEQKSSEAWRSFNQSLQQLNNSLERRQQASQQMYYQMQNQQYNDNLNQMNKSLKGINNSLNGIRYGY